MHPHGPRGPVKGLGLARLGWRRGLRGPWRPVAAGQHQRRGDRTSPRARVASPAAATRVGPAERREALFVNTRRDQPNGLAAALGCDLTEAGTVVTDADGRTNVAGVFAAGDGPPRIRGRWPTRSARDRASRTPSRSTASRRSSPRPPDRASDGRRRPLGDWWHATSDGDDPKGAGASASPASFERARTRTRDPL